MKKHEMNLRPSPFHLIKEGIKTIEMRLYDEKRKTISIGDIIIFTNTDNSNEKIKVQVINLFQYRSFQELYQNLPLLECGYTNETIEKASYHDMEEYYSIEKQLQYGVLGIKIKIIK